MAALGSTCNLPEGFHYETRYILLCYLGLPPRPRARTEEGISGQTTQEPDVDKPSRMKEQIEEQLKQLEEEITASFSTTGFDRHTSLVFSPANPENSIEDCLAVLGDRVSRVLDTYLTTATESLLSGQLGYEDFQSAVKEVSSHSEGGWSKVLVPLVLLQTLHCKGQSLNALLSLGERYLVEAEAHFIMQQGGWGAVFSLEDVEEPGVLIAEDSNDIYILSGEQGHEQLSPSEALLISVPDSSSSLSSWHRESLPASLSSHADWAHVSTMEPEDAKSVDSGEGVASTEERSENNSSNSDIVHVEREEAELLEEGEAVEGQELQESLLSVLGTESDLEGLTEEFRKEESYEQEPVSEAQESLMSIEEQIVIRETTPSLEAAVLPIVANPKTPTSSCPTGVADVPVNVQQEPHSSFSSDVPTDDPESLIPSSFTIIPDTPVEIEPESVTPSSSTIAADVPVNLQLGCSAHLSAPIAGTPQVLDPDPQSAQQDTVPAPMEPQILKAARELEAKSEPHPEAAQTAPVHEILPQEPRAEAIISTVVQESPSSAPERPSLEPSAPSQAPFILPFSTPPEPEPCTASDPLQESPAVVPERIEPAFSEFPVLLYGGAALVAIAALVAYGVLAYRKKY